MNAVQPTHPRRRTRGTTTSLNIARKFLQHDIAAAGGKQKFSKRGRTACDELDLSQLEYAHAQLELREGKVHCECTTTVALLPDCDKVFDTSEEHLVHPDALRKPRVALPQAHEQHIVRDHHAREACVCDAPGIEREGRVQYGEHEGVGVVQGRRVGAHGVSMLQDRPVDGEMTFDKRLLQDGGEVQALCAARLGAAAEQGQLFVLGGANMREEIAEERLGRTADLVCGFR